MFGTEGLKKATAMTTLAGMLVAGVMLVLPGIASAQYAEMLTCPLDGSPNQTLRTPLIPGAPSGAPYQAAYPGQPPAIGHGSSPARVTPGDYGGPQAPPSGFADQTHGNIFSTRQGQGAIGPQNYVSGAGRYVTESGQQQGMYEYGQGQQNGNGFGPGGKNGGPGWINNGGPAGNATPIGPGGKNGGTGWVNNGGAAADASSMGWGGKNGGRGLINNGGPAADAEGMGSGGKLGGTGYQNNGGPAADASWMGPGGKNGGTEMGAGGHNAGNGIVNNGGPASDASSMGPGGKNGGRGMGAGGHTTGNGIVNNGGPASDAQSMGPGGSNGGRQVINNGGSNGVGVVNNGGPRSDAAGSGDRLYSHQKQPNRYDFKGPLPTVRTFSRYLVTLGVVAATVFMALAAWSMVMGSQYGGARVMGAACGLLMLLAGYTIWKIVTMNTFHANSTGWESHYRDGSPQNIQGPGTPQPNNNGPFVPPQNPNN